MDFARDCEGTEQLRKCQLFIVIKFKTIHTNCIALFDASFFQLSQNTAVL